MIERGIERTEDRERERGTERFGADQDLNWEIPGLSSSRAVAVLALVATLTREVGRESDIFV